MVVSMQETKETKGKMQQGLLYIPLNDKGERAGHPFKASLFGKSAGQFLLWNCILRNAKPL